MIALPTSFAASVVRQLAIESWRSTLPTPAVMNNPEMIIRSRRRSLKPAREPVQHPRVASCPYLMKCADPKRALPIPERPYLHCVVMPADWAKRWWRTSALGTINGITGS